MQTNATDVLLFGNLCQTILLAALGTLKMSENLAQQTCIPCSGSLPPATPEEITQYHREVPDWQVISVDGVAQIQRQYGFANFQQALDFTNKVGEVAELMGHHPALLTEWGKVTVTWWTHAIAGLHQNDFIMAAKTDEVAEHCNAKASATSVGVHN